MSHKQIYYSDKYDDDKYEYRHVMLPKDIAKRVPKTHLMSESEWRNLGVQQSQGWVHYMIHQPGDPQKKEHAVGLSRIKSVGDCFVTTATNYSIAQQAPSCSLSVTFLQGTSKG
ncbi:cyclin-dependent kinases regulatory subunit 1 isoform X1 [Dunckerocampus dactyliophorus]|uniref:cyclin-dependent kinases regulatory subunit 1 isoform X1 n=1 Tax=Dunckerocampus dactyliophorus TaxID=161453 RepID=UPI002404E3E9|nr:cyclin-dependent kinases regulatory subunit 1 isoform X1 [Dunckerocampus dactyliophorus]